MARTGEERADQQRVPTRVVIVDDDDEMRLLVAAMLRIKLGAEVVGEGATGDAAIELCEELQPDVLVLDHVMPDRSGGDSIEAVRTASPNTCIVMFSATLLYAVDLGEGAFLPDRFVSKSDGLVGLHAAVQACIDEHEAAAGR